MHAFIHTVLQEIERQKKRNARLLIAIDGRCASGKTTLAVRLRQALACNVVPMDHFFLRPAQRTKDRLNEPGGNVDYERVLNDVILPMTDGRPISYRPYDCRGEDFLPPRILPANTVTILEGSYSCHPALIGYSTLKLFLSIDPITQLRRIQARDGETHAKTFAAKWIPLEERYFAACRIQEQCDLTFFAMP